jgi:ABC-type branched-subunit amino acid transport system substrate-binding protein
VEGAIFPAGLLLSENYPKQRDFLRQYTDSYGGTPDLLAAQAYEALELVAQAAEGSSGNRNSAVQALLSMGQFESPLGILSFDASRVASRTLHILTLSPGGSVVVQ